MAVNRQSMHQQHAQIIQFAAAGCIGVNNVYYIQSRRNANHPGFWFYSWPIAPIQGHSPSFKSIYNHSGVVGLIHGRPGAASAHRPLVVYNTTSPSIPSSEVVVLIDDIPSNHCIREMSCMLWILCCPNVSCQRTHVKRCRPLQNTFGYRHAALPYLQRSCDCPISRSLQQAKVNHQPLSSAVQAQCILPAHACQAIQTVAEHFR
jgi:hypothetical protein